MELSPPPPSGLAHVALASRSKFSAHRLVRFRSRDGRAGCVKRERKTGSGTLSPPPLKGRFHGIFLHHCLKTHAVIRVAHGEPANRDLDRPTRRNRKLTGQSVSYFICRLCRFQFPAVLKFSAPTFRHARSARLSGVGQNRLTLLEGVFFSRRAPNIPTLSTPSPAAHAFDRVRPSHLIL